MSRSNGESSAVRPSKSVAERGGVDAPLALGALDHGRLAGLADVDRLDRHRRSSSAGRCRARRAAARSSTRRRLLDRRDDDVGRVDALGQVPQPLAPDAPGDRDLAAHHQELQHLGDVAVVRPPGRRPRHDARVRDVARGQRPGAAEQLEDVAPEAVVVAEPVTRAARSCGQSAAPARYRPRSLIGRTSALCSNSVRSCSSACWRCVGLVRRAEAAPGDEVRARRDRRGRVDLQQRQPLARPSSRSVGRGASSSCARTAIRRACAFVSRCTGGGYVRGLAKSQ